MPPRPSRPSSSAVLATLTVLAAGLGYACTEKAGAASQWEAQVDTVGDTVVVRTVSGGVWPGPVSLTQDMAIGVMEGDDQYLLGDIRGMVVDREGFIYVYDAQVPALRKYDREGRYVMTIGHQGGGPGEYKSSDGGMAILHDGSIVLRDQGNARFQLWSPEGEPRGEWRYRGGFQTSTPMFVDTAGFAYSPSIDFGSKPPWKTSLVKYSPAGQALDTIPVPDWHYDAPEISAQKSDRTGKNTSTMVNNVPFSPAAQWTFSPLGYFVGGVSTLYSIQLMDGSHPRRIRTRPGPRAGECGREGGCREQRHREHAQHGAGLEMERTGHSGHQAALHIAARRRGWAHLGAAVTAR